MEPCLPYYADPERELTTWQQEKYKNCIRKRAERVPLQHITGEQEFMGLTFHVNEHVLIPRQDTEILVEEALEQFREGRVPAGDPGRGGSEILDLCTGSGCILLSVLYYARQMKGVSVQGTGSDLSEKALETAEENAKRLGIRAEFVQGDLFENLKGRYAMILSNPLISEVLRLEACSRRSETTIPRMALDGSEDGLIFYRKIIGRAAFIWKTTDPDV